MVGIAHTGSGFNNCHRHFPELLDAVKRGVLAAGALPVEFPTISLGEVFLSPTSLKYRNLMSMDTEEMIRAQPMDAVVLMGGCDKTVPAQLMGAVSAGRPAIMLVAGPMMTGRHRGERLGACTDCRRFWARYRAGEVDADEICEVEGQLAVTAGTCAVMGTASTMACVAEALGMILPGTAAIPAVHADRLRAAEATGAAAVKLIGSRLTPDRIVNAKSVENALRVLLALGGSTNAVIHLTAIAGRAGVQGVARPAQRAVRLDAGAGQPQAGRQRLHGGLLRRRRHGRACCASSSRCLHLDCMTVTGETLGERLAADGGGYVDRTDHRGARHSRSSRRAAWSRCSAISRPRARSSSARRPTPNCSSTRAGRWCSPRSPISPHASTIPRSTSRPKISWSCRTPARMRRRRCPRPAICRSRRSSRSAASRT